VLFSCLYGQAPDTLWVRIYGGQFDDYGNGVCETSDGGLILTGMSSTSGAGDVYVVRTNADGDTLWTNAYGGNYWDHGYAIQPTLDNGFITAGYTCSYNPSNNEDFFLVKIDSSGNEQWIRNYGGDSMDAAYGVTVTSDSGYIVVGRTLSYGSGDMDIYCVKVRANGDTLWTRTYGGPADEGSYGIVEKGDSCYIIAGHTASQGAGNSDIYILCIDLNGDTLWTRTYGGVGFDFAYGITAAQNNGFIVVGKTRSYGAGSWDLYLIGTDQFGDTLWTKVYGGILDDVGFSIQETYDGGYIVAGYTMSFGVGNADIYLLKIDAHGDTLWTSVLGGIYEDLGRSIIQTSDSGYVCCGLTNSFGSGGFNYILAKLAPDTLGLLESERLALITTAPMLSVYPNPSHYNVQLLIRDPGTGFEKGSIHIYDCLGRSIKHLPFAKMKGDRLKTVLWDMTSDQWDRVPSGVYYVEVRAGQVSERRKVVIFY